MKVTLLREETDAPDGRGFRALSSGIRLQGEDNFRERQFPVPLPPPVPSERNRHPTFSGHGFRGWLPKLTDRMEHCVLGGSPALNARGGDPFTNNPERLLLLSRVSRCFLFLHALNDSKEFRWRIPGLTAFPAGPFQQSCVFLKRSLQTASPNQHVNVE